MLVAAVYMRFTSTPFEFGVIMIVLGIVLEIALRGGTNGLFVYTEILAALRCNSGVFSSVHVLLVTTI